MQLNKHFIDYIAQWISNPNPGWFPTIMAVIGDYQLGFYISKGNTLIQVTHDLPNISGKKVYVSINDHTTEEISPRIVMNVYLNNKRSRFQIIDMSDTPEEVYNFNLFDEYKNIMVFDEINNSQCEISDIVLNDVEFLMSELQDDFNRKELIYLTDRISRNDIQTLDDYISYDDDQRKLLVELNDN